jgi:hypothetical protein
MIAKIFHNTQEETWPAKLYIYLALTRKFPLPAHTEFWRQTCWEFHLVEHTELRWWHLWRRKWRDPFCRRQIFHLLREFKRFQDLINHQVFLTLFVSYKARKVLFSKVFSIVVDQLRRKKKKVVLIITTVRYGQFMLQNIFWVTILSLSLLQPIYNSMVGYQYVENLCKKALQLRMSCQSRKLPCQRRIVQFPDDRNRWLLEKFLWWKSLRCLSRDSTDLPSCPSRSLHCWKCLSPNFQTSGSSCRRNGLGHWGMLLIWGKMIKTSNLQHLYFMARESGLLACISPYLYHPKSSAVINTWTGTSWGLKHVQTNY